MNVPAPWEFVLLALAAYRLYRILAKDTVTEPVRAALSYPDDTALTLSSPPPEKSVVRDSILTPVADYQVFAEERPKSLRVYVSTLIRCPWCSGFYSSVAVWALWLAFPELVLLLAVPLALSAVVGLLTKNLDR